ncbi:MAG: DUF1697 domain-containing protein [Peptococcaceae bacterium]
MALLRSINVGGKNKVKMADLKRTFASIGLINVQTYIQSGNVIFESNENEEALREVIESALEKNFGITTSAILRTAGELEQLMHDLPFSKEEVMEAEMLNSEGESLYVDLLIQAPAQEKIAHLHTFRSENDKYKIKNRDIYLLLRHSIRNSKLANSLQKLGIPGTVRNWKTVNKLQILVKARTDKC